MKKLSVVLIAILFLFSASVALAVDKEITLSWDHDGEDLAGFRIYYGLITSDYGFNVDVVMGTKCADIGITPEEFCHKLTLDVPADAITNYFFVATAYDADTNESAYSDPEVLLAYDFVVPPPVSDLSASYDKHTSTLTFSWSYETAWLPKITKWSLWSGDAAGGPYVRTVDIPYDSEATPPYTTDVVIPAPGPGESLEKFYVLVSHRGPENNDAFSVNGNEVKIVVEKMPPKSPFEFKIKIR